MPWTTTSQSVTDRIRAMLVEAVLKPGQRLQERNLAESLGVSRTPVRDSLQVLASEGLLDYSPHSGYRVRSFDIRDVVSAFQVRIALEGMACRCAAELGLTPESIRQLRENVDRGFDLVQGSAWTPDDQMGWLLLNEQFHDVVLESSGNKYLADMVSQAIRIPKIYVQAMHLHNMHNLGQSYTQSEARNSTSDHRRILDLLESRQGDRAEHLMREHLYANLEHIRRRWGEGGWRSDVPPPAEVS